MPSALPGPPFLRWLTFFGLMAVGVVGLLGHPHQLNGLGLLLTCPLSLPSISITRALQAPSIQVIQAEVTRSAHRQPRIASPTAPVLTHRWLRTDPPLLAAAAGILAAGGTALWAHRRPVEEESEGFRAKTRRAALTSFVAMGFVVPSMKADSKELPEIQKYSDFTRLPSGVQYKEILPGAGSKVAQIGDRIVYKWEGYTAGYSGRPFQKSNGPVGGAFTDDEASYARFVLGNGEVVAGVEQAVVGMREGALRQIIIPPGPLSYPEDDPNHTRVGPTPSTFSGFRALNFVLFNQGGTMDKTILINVKVVRIDRPGENGFAP